MRHQKLKSLHQLIDAQRFLGWLVPGEGFEPPTFGLQNRCTTTVLTRRAAWLTVKAGPHQHRPDPQAPGLCRSNMGENQHDPRTRLEPARNPASGQSASWAHTADIRGDLELRGNVIGPYDLMIAGYARSRGLVIVTGSLGEFQRVPGLRCEGWQV